MPATGSGRSRVRSRLLLPVEAVVEDLNGSCAAGRRTSATATPPPASARSGSTRVERLALFIGKRHKRGRGFGWSVVAYLSPDQLGLISLYGTVVAPRATSPGGRNRMPAVNGVGEPCAGEPHARFDVAGAGATTA